jgi:ubiquinone/menaquinone biosynthesis C-methylase UbiE
MNRDEYLAMYDLEERLWWYRGMRSVTSSILEGYLGHDRGLKILDVGCGTGYSLAWLSRRYRIEEAYGVDVSPHAAEFWHSRGLHTAAIASACNLPFGENQFDLVTCFDVVYQLTPEQSEMALSEIYRVLKPGSLFFIREPAYDWIRGSHDVAVGTAHRFTRPELTAVLKSVGFSPIRTTYANSLLFWAAVPHRLLSPITGRKTSDVRLRYSWMNRAFASALALEARLLRRFAFPFGLSVVALARRP